MSDYAELLIRLGRRDADSYTVDAQFASPGSDAYTDPESGKVTFDFDALGRVVYDGEAYGALLTQSFFADPNVRMAFEKAGTAADQIPLRVRLFIEPDAEDLHFLYWETLRDPRNGTLLATGERVLFSRYLRSPDWRSVQRRPRAELRALVVVANPANLSDYKREGQPLTAIDVPAELALVEAGLGPLVKAQLASGGDATLSKVTERLREGYDILYLVCHGALIRDQPLLYLEKDDGSTHLVDGARLAEELWTLRMPPLVVVLASCQSAGSGVKGALAAVGPRLARAGVPAVLAMQGEVTIQTSGKFMRRFFVELGRDGQIDRAVAVARSEVKDRPDAWMPVLFTRLRSGCVWREPDVRGGQGFGKWPALITSIREGRCTPILGPGLIEFLLGPPREVAKRWADKHRFPMAPHQREDLPQVAQFLAIDQSDDFLRAQLRDHLEQEMWERYGEHLPATLRGAPLQELITEVGRQRRERDPLEAHRALARLPLPIYITTNPDNLLYEALAEAPSDPEAAHGEPEAKPKVKDPQLVLCRWNDDVDWPPSIYDKEPHYLPTPERPLIYHLFGQFVPQDSMILAEDDYFDYLIGLTRHESMIPKAVLRAWNDSAILFLGFQVDDWNFRVLFRSIMNQEGRSRRKNKANVAVQIDPEEGRSLDPQRARRYLEKYFQDDDINIYWGSTEEFIRELWQHWEESERQRQPRLGPAVATMGS